jgi:AraC-like DNA-binding protein
MNLNLLAISNLLVFVQGTLLGILFISNPKGGRSANNLLGLFIFLYNFGDLHSFFMSSGITAKHPWLLGFPSLFLFWYGPLLYFYTLSLLQPGFTWKKNYYLWFIPAGVELAGNFVLVSLGGEQVIALFYTEAFTLAAIVESFLASLFSVFLVLRSIRVIINMQDKNAQFGVKTKWLRIFLGYFLVRFLFWALYFTIVLSFGWTYNLAQYTDSVVAFLSAIDFIAIFYISFFSFRYFNEMHQKQKEAVFVLNSVQEDELFSKLKALMENEKIYRQHDLKMSDFAARLSTNVKYVSQIISSRTEGNFTSYVNSYRVAEIQSRINDNKSEHLTLAAIAEEAGFNSKATFNRVFKDITGQLPSEYRKHSLSDGR